MNRTIVAVCLVLCAPASRLHAGLAFYDPIYGTATTTNVAYGTGAINGGSSTTTLRLDLYRPTDIGQGALPTVSPGIVLVHGGGFTSGNKSDLATLASSLSKYGYTVVSINYRLYGNNPPWEEGAFDDVESLPFTLPGPPYASLPLTPAGINAVNAAVIDTMKAITWMKTNASTYNLDPNHIGLGGFSAGAITSLLLSYIDPDATTAPQAVLAFSGGMYGTEAVIPSNVPPAFVVHGTSDTVVPYAGSVAVANKLTSLGVYNEFYTQTGVGHTTNFNAVYAGETLFEHQIDFLRTYLVPVPEPSTMALAAIGLLGLIGYSRRRK